MNPIQAHQLNLDAAQRELDARNAQGEDVSALFVNQHNAAIERRLPIVEPPVLAHDTMMLTKWGNKLNQCMRTERKLIWNLLAHLEARGFKLTGANDGDEQYKLTDMKAAMEVVFSVDEAWLYVRKNKARIGHTIFIVLGNDGYDCVNDYSIGETDGFTAAMESFDFEQFV